MDETPMRIARSHALALFLAAASSLWAAAAAPQVLLHVSFDGSLDPSYSAFPTLRTSYISATYGQGKAGQAAEIGSDQFPAPLKFQAPKLLNKDRGSIELWYQPLWDPTDTAEHTARRELATDEAPLSGPGRFWLTIEKGALHFVWLADQTTALSTPIGEWQKGRWYHIVATWDNLSGIALYVDGKKVGDRTAAWQIPPSQTLYVGANYRGLSRATGLIDELRLYSQALRPEQAEVAALLTLKAGNAPPFPAPEADGAAPAAPQPRLTFHLTFDGTLDAESADGQAKPVIAKGTEFADGLLGKALVARSGIDLAYALDKNVSKEEGTITLWARALADAKGDQRVLVGDAREPGQDPPQPENALGLWVEAKRIPEIRFGISPAAVVERAPRWNDGEWHHIAVTWRRGVELVAYLNGSAMDTRVGSSATWDAAPSKLLAVGSVHGIAPAGAMLDDLRIYDRAISPEEVSKEAHRFVMPVFLELQPTLFEAGRAQELKARFYNLGTAAISTKATITITDPTGKQVASTTAAIDPGVGAWATVPIPLSAAALGAEGLYGVATSAPGKIGMPLGYLLVVQPEQRQPASAGPIEPHMRLQTVAVIDCARERHPTHFCSNSETRVVQTDAGAYLEGGPLLDDRFAFRFVVPDAGHPYMVLVTYPDNRARSAEITVTSRHFPDGADIATGYLRSSDPNTMRMVEMPLYFWPREQENAIIFRTLRPGRPAACARIGIYRVLGVLPAPRQELPPDGGRDIGLYWPDPTLPIQFGARAVFPTETYRTLSRLTEYMRFTGQNVLTYPVVAENGALYTSERERFRMGPAALRHCNDWIEYLLYLFEHHDLRFLPDISLTGSYALADKYGEQLDRAILAGAETARMVGWDGSMAHALTGEPPVYNPLHADVRAALLGHIDALLARYGASPALDGISIRFGHNQCVWFASIQSGYGDWVIAQFEKDTGIEVPADKSGSARFSQRARWLLSQKYEEWVAWRCRKIHDLMAEAAGRLQQRRPDLKLYLTLALPDSSLWNPLFNAAALSPRYRTMGQLYREAGMDMSLYADLPNVVVRRVARPTEDSSLAYDFGGPGPLADLAQARDAAWLTESSAPFRAHPLPALACSYARFESTVGRYRPIPGFWWSANPYRISQPTPPGRAFLAPYAQAVADLDAVSLTAGGTTTVTMGHERELLSFARAFRALPRKPFQDLPGMSDPVCARELRDGDAHYLYLVNRAGYPVEAYIAFEGQDVALQDLATAGDIALESVKDKPLPAAMPAGFVSEHKLPAVVGPLPGDAATQKVTGALLQVTLPPYQLSAYRVRGKDARVVYAASTAPAAERLRLAQHLNAARILLHDSRAGAEASASARAVLTLIDRAWQKGELSRVAHLLESYPLARLR